ncbi:hypothetical protein QSJ19_04880 [Gordonia sp. ABSL11-1]|uniref:hypothetical protein n=1 Tax=Gordonia sp. ABSL11-1 TaxID=3053924 RepID=UPI002572B85F|nr:hypothetical protein [Gordonia sp. ABSL11-1]MDL9944930.1 hypothetical protein [Gordonia sp. ABSL11-1]
MRDRFGRVMSQMSPQRPAMASGASAVVSDVIWDNSSRLVDECVDNPRHLRASGAAEDVTFLSVVECMFDS